MNGRERWAVLWKEVKAACLTEVCDPDVASGSRQNFQDRFARSSLGVGIIKGEKTAVILDRSTLRVQR